MDTHIDPIQLSRSPRQEMETRERCSPRRYSKLHPRHVQLIARESGLRGKRVGSNRRNGGAKLPRVVMPSLGL